MKLNTNLLATFTSDLRNNRIQNLFRNLQKDQIGIFYSVLNLSRSILNKARKSTYDKDKVFVNLYNKLEDKDFYQNNNLPFVTPFVNKEVILTIQHFRALVSLLNCYLLILPI